jgi:hypothetical protein
MSEFQPEENFCFGKNKLKSENAETKNVSQSFDAADLAIASSLWADHTLDEGDLIHRQKRNVKIEAGANNFQEGSLRPESQEYNQWNQLLPQQ